MTHITHTEIVSVLDEYDYKALLEFFDVFPPSDAQEHFDHYFSDKEGLLAKHNITFRVRNKKGVFQIDLKIPSTQEPGGMIDLKVPISKESFESFKNNSFFPTEIEDVLKKLNIGKINYIGFVPTKRITVPCGSVEGKWVIDHSTFPLEKVEYRIELKHGKRFCKEAKDLFEKMLRQIDLQPFEPPSKFQILMNCLREDEKVKKTIALDINKRR